MTGAGEDQRDGGAGGQDELVLAVATTGNLIDAIGLAFDTANGAVTISETGATEGLLVSAVEVFAVRDAVGALSCSHGARGPLFGVA